MGSQQPKGSVVLNTDLDPDGNVNRKDVKTSCGSEKGVVVVILGDFKRFPHWRTAGHPHSKPLLQQTGLFRCCPSSARSRQGYLACFSETKEHKKPSWASLEVMMPVFSLRPPFGVRRIAVSPQEKILDESICLPRALLAMWMLMLWKPPQSCCKDNLSEVRFTLQPCFLVYKVS